jgi:hypothetical protein
MGWEFTAWVVPTVFWIFVGSVILVPVWLRSRERRRLYDTVRVAYEAGQSLTPDLILALRAGAAEAAIPPAERDLRTGVLFLAAGLGTVGLGYGLWYGLTTVDEPSAYATGLWLSGVGALVCLIGLVHIAFWLARRGRAARLPIARGSSI